MKNYILMISVFTLSACDSGPKSNFCDEWSTNDGSGPSINWVPTPEQMETISVDLKAGRKFVCAEINPSGRVSVIGYAEDHFGLLYELTEEKLVFIEEELIVTVR